MRIPTQRDREKLEPFKASIKRMGMLEQAALQGEGKSNRRTLPILSSGFRRELQKSNQ